MITMIDNAPVNLLDLPDLSEPVAKPIRAETIEPLPLVAQPAVVQPTTPAVAKSAVPARRPGPTKKAIAQYREAVLRAVESGATITRQLVFDARLTVEICKADFTMYRTRLQAKHSLDVEVPALEKKAAEAERVAREAVPFEKRTMTFAEWEAFRPRILFSRRTDEDLAAEQARNFAQQVRQEALRNLRETSDPELGRQISELTATAQEIKGTMTARQKGSPQHQRPH